MTILVTGAGGQLGRELVAAFAPRSVVGLTRADLDVADEAAVTAVVHELRPAVVVNAAAMTDVDACERDPTAAHAVNALGPWWLARACERTGAALVTVSSDHVFGAGPPGPGGARHPYVEHDPVAPVNAYGRAKAAGEQLVREALPRHHIVRTSWVFSATGRNFVTTMLELADRGQPIRVVDDQFGRPTAARPLARAIARVVTAGRYGTVHLACEGVCTWFELARAVFDLSGREVDLRPQPSSALDRPAPRPAWAVLGTLHAEALGLGPLPTWHSALAAVLGELGVAVPEGPA